MSRIQDLDKILNGVRTLSKGLTLISDIELENHVGIDIAMLDEYLIELKQRGYINYSFDGCYITLKGRMALENSKNGKPFQDEIKKNRLQRKWTIVKITAGVINSLAIITIAFWSQFSSNVESKLVDKLEKMENQIRIEKSILHSEIDSLRTLLNKSNNTDMDDIAKTSFTYK